MSTGQHTNAYLASLPAGVGAHPQCMVKGWVVNGVLRTEALQDFLPTAVVGQLRPAPLASAWVSQVAFHAAWQAINERFTDPAAAARWWSSTAQRITTAPFARPLLHYTRPERFLERLPANWETLFKGSTVSVEQGGPTRATIKLAYPKGLFPRSIATSLAPIFLAGLQASAAHEPTVRIASWTADHSDYLASWSKPLTPSWPKS